jgi:hypothetical protein
MLIRVAQRADDDCSIAVMATVMGPPYRYERVASDQKRYPKVRRDGTFLAWWERYLWDEGFPNEYQKLADVGRFVGNGRIVGILSLAPLGGRIGHLIAIDECGIINPSIGWPERIANFAPLLEDCRRSGGTYEPDDDFLAVWLK